MKLNILTGSITGQVRLVGDQNTEISNICIDSRKVQPGDLIMADCDGIVCVPRAMIEEVLAKAEEKVAYEGGRVNAIANYRKCKAEGKELPDLTPGWVKEMLGR